MAHVVPSEEEILAWSSLTPAPPIPPRAANRPTRAAAPIAEHLTALPRVNPSDPWFIDLSRDLNHDLGLQALTEAEQEWIRTKALGSDFWSAWKARSQQQLDITRACCQNPAIHIDDIEEIIDHYGSGPLLESFEEGGGDFHTIFRFLLSEDITVQQIRSRRLSPDLRLRLHTHRQHRDASVRSAARDRPTKERREGERASRES